jgi:hypothetical protein
MWAFLATIAAVLLMIFADQPRALGDGDLRRITAARLRHLVGVSWLAKGYRAPRSYSADHSMIYLLIADTCDLPGGVAARLGHHHGVGGRRLAVVRIALGMLAFNGLRWPARPLPLHVDGQR